MKYLVLLSAVVAMLMAGCSGDEENTGQRERFVAIYKTATTYTMTTSTTTKFYTCASTTLAGTCTGRRRRKRKADVIGSVPSKEEQHMDYLKSSMNDQPQSQFKPQEGKLGFTIWTTKTSTLTSTSTSTNTATTISLNYNCTPLSTGMITVPACG